MLRVVVAVAVALALVGVGIATRVSQRGDDETQARLQRLADVVVEAGVPGTIVLLRDGSHAWSAASGVADRRSGE